VVNDDEFDQKEIDAKYKQIMGKDALDLKPDMTDLGIAISGLLREQ
jgi:hypothetical protein